MSNQLTPIAFSGDIPKFYDAHLGPLFFEPYALDMADRVGRLAPMHILELASGTGRLTGLLPAVVSKDAVITASDLNPAMVSFGRNKAKGDNITWMEVDAVMLPFEDATFDCVVVQFGVMFYSDRMEAFKEALRVLKPGGTFIFNCWDRLENNPMPTIANRALQHFFPVDTPAFYSVPFSYHDEKTIADNLKEAGFKDIKIELVKLKGYSHSAADTAKGLIYGTPTITAIEQRDAAKLSEVLHWIEKEIIQQFGKTAFQPSLQAFVVSGVKG